MMSEIIIAKTAAITTKIPPHSNPGNLNKKKKKHIYLLYSPFEIRPSHVDRHVSHTLLTLIMTMYEYMLWYLQSKNPHELGKDRARSSDSYS